jgi:hypothetical protein
VFVNHETGECWKTQSEFKDSTKKRGTFRPTGYLGIDSKWVSDCKDAQDLLQAVKQVDSYLQPKSLVMVDHAYLLDCVAQGYISAKNLSILLKLSRKCTAWNYGFISKAKLLSLSGCTSKHFARWCDEVAPYVKFEKLHLSSDELKIVFNPLVVWKGCKFIRNGYINQYYSISSPGGGETTSE